MPGIDSQRARRRLLTTEPLVLLAETEGATTADDLCVRSATLTNLGRAKEAERSILAALAIAPSDPYAEVLATAGHAAVGRLTLDEALARLDHIGRAHADDAQLALAIAVARWNLRITARKGTGNLPPLDSSLEAERLAAAAEAVLQQDPHDVGALVRRAIAEHATGSPRLSDTLGRIEDIAVPPWPAFYALRMAIAKEARDGPGYRRAFIEWARLRGWTCPAWMPSVARRVQGVWILGVVLCFGAGFFGQWWPLAAGTLLVGLATYVVWEMLSRDTRKIRLQLVALALIPAAVAYELASAAPSH